MLKHMPVKHVPVRHMLGHVLKHEPDRHLPEHMTGSPTLNGSTSRLVLVAI